MFYVLYQKKGVFGKPVAAGYKDRKDAEKFAKSLGNNHNTMILDKQSMKNVKGVDVNESQIAKKDAEHMERNLRGKGERDVKSFVDRVYKFHSKDIRKYMVDAFLDYQKGKISKKEFVSVLGDLHESVNESAGKEAMGIAALTGTRGSAVQDFIDKNRINSKKLFRALKSANLQGRMNFASALSGKPGNPNEKLTIKLFGESVNEGKKRFRQQNGIGKSKYTISYHDGKKKHKDGSDFFDIQIFRNKKDLETFKKDLVSKGFVKESVNEDTKKRFDVDFYKGDGDRQTSHEEIIRGDKFSDVVSQATKVAKSKGMNHVEFYYKDAFIGSIDKRNGYEFKKGRSYQKSPLSVNEAKFGYKDSTASYINNHKDEYKQAEKMNKGNEVKFYDLLQKMEDKIGHPKFMIFLSNALRGYKVDMYKDPKIKNPQDAQEALFLLSK